MTVWLGRAVIVALILVAIDWASEKLGYRRE